MVHVWACTIILDRPRAPAPQFVSGKVEMQDTHIKHQSVRAYELEQEHKVSAWSTFAPLGLLLLPCAAPLPQRIMQSLDLTKLEIKPIPRPKQE